MGDPLPGNWMIQPVLQKKSPGFFATRGELDKRLAPKPSALEKNGALKTF